MKGWIVWWGDDICTLVHADTRGKAKLLGMSILDGDDFLFARALRAPGLDDKPITYQNAKDAGFQYSDGGYSEDGDGDGHLLPELFTNDCHCDICKGAI
jgi:hypothetical protein